MSFQRVIETARKTGVPVIVTDLGGREPMVILSLEQFEAMMGEKRQSSDAVLADLAQEQVEARIEEVASELDALAQQNIEGPEMSVEERFYIEPLEEGK